MDRAGQVGDASEGVEVRDVGSRDPVAGVPLPAAIAARQPAAVLALQRAAGNRAVSRILARTITTKPPDGSQPPASGDWTGTVNGVDVRIKADGPGDKAAYTSFDLSMDPNPSYHSTDGKVDDVTQPVYKLEIQTTWEDGFKPSDQSAYGRGTTKEDIDAKTTTLGFHESCHGADMLAFIVKPGPPTYPVKVGDSDASAAGASKAHEGKVTKFTRGMRNFSVKNTDQVGKKGKHSQDG
jgi:hypothetical protein